MKGRLNKPICAIMTSFVLILGTFAIAFPAQDAEATHVKVKAFIQLWRGSTMIDEWETIVTCDTLACGIVDVDIPTKRDEGRFLRWCGTDTKVMSIPDTASSVVTNCNPNGNGPWQIRVGSALLNNDETTNFNDHGSNVVTSVIAT